MHSMTDGCRAGEAVAEVSGDEGASGAYAGHVVVRYDRFPTCMRWYALGADAEATAVALVEDVDMITTLEGTVYYVAPLADAAEDPAARETPTADEVRSRRRAGQPFVLYDRVLCKRS